MATETDIKNMALGHLGNSAQASFDSAVNVPAVKICNLYYDQARDLSLFRARWKCALIRIALTVDATAPAFDWSYRFLLPSDCVRVLEMYYKDQQFDVEGQYLLTNQSTAKILYTARVTVGSFNPYLVQVIALQLAILAAPALLGGKSAVKVKAALFRELMDDVLPEAQAKDAMQALVVDHYRANPTGWVDARGGYPLSGLILTRPS